MDKKQTNEVDALRSRRNAAAETLMKSVRSYADHTAAIQREQIKSSGSEDFLDFQTVRLFEQKAIATIREQTETFQTLQIQWSLVLLDKKENARSKLIHELKDLTFDWTDTSRLGDQIDAATIRWGAYGVAAQGGESVPVPQQICGMVASGATTEDLIDLRKALSHMPNFLGGEDYRYCCMIAMGLEWRQKGTISSMEEINALLHWYDRAQKLMASTQPVVSDLFKRMGL